MKRILLLATALTISAAMVADAAPRKRNGAQQSTETTGVAAPAASDVTGSVPATPRGGQVRNNVQQPVTIDTPRPTTQWAGGPTRHGNWCWAQSDNRGFGFWDTCLDGPERAARARGLGIAETIDVARSQRDSGNDSTGGGGEGGGGGGGGR